MQRKSYPCPCGGKVQWKKSQVVIEGINMGLQEIEFCQKCGEEYFPEETMDVVEKKLKENNLWGIKRREASLWKSGNSVLLRIPKEIATQLNLKPDEKVTLYTEGKNKLIMSV